MALGHTGCKRGKRVFIRLKDGERFVDKFIERNHRAVRLEKAGWVNKSDLKSLSILR